MKMAAQRTQEQSGSHRHLIGGEVRGIPHEPGDPVAPSATARQIREWLNAGIIEPIPTERTAHGNDSDESRK